MFKAAGKVYRSERELRALCGEEFRSGVELDCWVGLCRDVHGREVLHVSRRFPTFDSWDLLYDKRYYHWYHIRHQGGLTLVYTSDDTDEVRITEALQPERSVHAGILREVGWL